MKGWILAMATAATMWTVTGCAKPITVTTQGPSSLHPELRTYALLNHPVGSTLSTRHVFLSAVHEVMAEKGFVQAPKAEADLLITFKALMADVNADSSQAASSQKPAATDSTGGSPVTADDVSKVVVVQVEESRSDRVIWVGWTAGEFPSYQVVEKTRESVEKILARLPKRS